MTKYLLILILIFGYLNADAKYIDDLVANGKKLNRIARAMERARNEVNENYSEKSLIIGEYVPVIQGASYISVLCFRKNSEIPVMRVTVEELDTVLNSTIDTMFLSASETELKILRIMNSARAIFSYNANEYFKFDKAYTYRMIPLFINKYFEVFLIPYDKEGKVIIGADYFVRLDLKSRLLLRETVHKGVCPTTINTKINALEHTHDKHNKKLSVTDIFYALNAEKGKNYDFQVVKIKKKIYLINAQTLAIRKMKSKEYNELSSESVNVKNKETENVKIE